MSYRIDSQLLFIDLTDEEADRLTEFAQDVQFGHVDLFNPAFVEWCRIGKFNDRQLLVYSTLFVQRLSLSLALHWRRQTRRLLEVVDVVLKDDEK